MEDGGEVVMTMGITCVVLCNIVKLDTLFEGQDEVAMVDRDSECKSNNGARLTEVRQTVADCLLRSFFGCCSVYVIQSLLPALVRAAILSRGQHL